jgi:hypothetical protein
MVPFNENFAPKEISVGGWFTTSPGWLASKTWPATSSAAAGFIKPVIRNSEENMVTRNLKTRNVILLICSLFKVTRVTSGTRRLTLYLVTPIT